MSMQLYTIIAKQTIDNKNGYQIHLVTNANTLHACNDLQKGQL
jgi:hypothetical protein